MLSERVLRDEEGVMAESLVHAPTSMIFGVKAVYHLENKYKKYLGRA